MKQASFRLTIFLALFGLMVTGCSESTVGQLETDRPALMLASGGYEPLELVFKPTTSLGATAGSLRVFLHLIADDGELLRTFDHPLPEPWTPGTEIRYRQMIYQSALADGLKPGNYRLTVGLYDESGNRFPLSTPGERVGRDEYLLSSVEISSDSSTPTIGFGEGWSTPLAGVDRQVLSRRRLESRAILEVRDHGPSGSLWMEFFLPSADGEARRRPLDEASETEEAKENVESSASVTLRASCNGFEITLSGEQRHAVEIPVESESGNCEIEWVPASVVQFPDGESWALELQNIAWRSAS